MPAGALSQPRRVRALPLIAMLICVASGAMGCKSKFTGERLNTLRLGESSVAEAKLLLGEPRQEEAVSEGGLRRQTLTYWANSNVVQSQYARAAVLEFLNDRMIAYEFFGIADEDQRKLTPADVAAIQVGRTTRDDLLKSYGIPSGKALPETKLPDFRPSLKPGTAEVWQYMGGNVGFRSIELQQHLISLSSGGYVQNVSTREITRR